MPQATLFGHGRFFEQNFPPHGIPFAYRQNIETWSRLGNPFWGHTQPALLSTFLMGTFEFHLRIIDSRFLPRVLWGTLPLPADLYVRPCEAKVPYAKFPDSLWYKLPKQANLPHLDFHRL